MKKKIDFQVRRKLLYDRIYQCVDIMLRLDSDNYDYVIRLLNRESSRLIRILNKEFSDD